MCRLLYAIAQVCLQAALLLPVVVHAGMSSYPISITHERQGDNYAIVASNRGPAPISIRLSLPVAENVTTDRQYPLFSTVAPHTVQTLMHVGPLKRDAKYRFSTLSERAFGSPEALPDVNALYRLPFPDGHRIRISQAFDGVLSTHKGPESMHAVDFPVAEATPVVAARSGIVIDVDADYIEGGPHDSLKARANQVTILHSDGTLGHYAHLAPGRHVNVGQHVEAGNLLGLSGNTGFSHGPHLHFAVLRVVVETSRRVSRVSLPVQFHNYNPSVVFVPRQGLDITVDYAHPLPLDLPSSVFAQLPPGQITTSPQTSSSGVSEITSHPRLSQNPTAFP